MPATPRADRGRLSPAAAAPARGETVEVVHRGRDVTIEHLLSSAAVSPAPYDQAHDEWVVLLEGRAVLDVEGERVTLGPGDWLFLEAHRRHRILATDQGTRWLAVHLPHGG